MMDARRVTRCREGSIRVGPIAGGSSGDADSAPRTDGLGPTTRLVSLDMARGLAIVLVVFGHAWRGIASAGIIEKDAFFHAVDSGIYLFHMPVFFLISGFFFDSRKSSTFPRWLLGRFEVLLYPLILWSLIMAVALFLSGSMSNRGGMRLIDIPLYPLYPPQDVYWFLWALFQIQILGRLVQSAPGPAALPVATAFSCLPPLLLPAASTPLLASQVYMNLPFFLLGMLLERHRRPIPGRSALLLGLPLFVAAEAWITSHPDLLGTPAAFVAGLAAVAGFLFLSVCFGHVAPKNVRESLCFFSLISMTIYVAHVIPSAAVRIVLLKLRIEDPTIQLLLQMVAGLGAPALLYLFARRTGSLRMLGLGRDRARVREG